VKSTLRDDQVEAVLARLRALDDSEDEAAKRRVRAREAERGAKIYGAELTQLYATAPLSIAREVGELLYMLALAARPRRIVEFGASAGYSTIHLASALRDLGSGSLISTELVPEKAEHARQNLVDAGLDDLVELRVGDALQTLGNSEDQIDLLFLDGWNDLYLAVLGLLEPRLRSGAVVIADMTKGDPHHEDYRRHVRDPANGYFSIELPLDDGVVVSVR
jgi:predicted O-methyltransferase YrrM